MTWSSRSRGLDSFSGFDPGKDHGVQPSVLGYVSKFGSSAVARASGARCSRDLFDIWWDVGIPKTSLLRFANVVLEADFQVGGLQLWTSRSGVSGLDQTFIAFEKILCKGWTSRNLMLQDPVVASPQKRDQPPTCFFALEMLKDSLASLVLHINHILECQVNVLCWVLKGSSKVYSNPTDFMDVEKKCGWLPKTWCFVGVYSPQLPAKYMIYMVNQVVHCGFQTPGIYTSIASHSFLCLKLRFTASE